jgi:hypothetical protein
MDYISKQWDSAKSGQQPLVFASISCSFAVADGVITSLEKDGC